MCSVSLTFAFSSSSNCTCQNHHVLIIFLHLKHQSGGSFDGLELKKGRTFSTNIVISTQEGLFIQVKYLELEVASQSKAAWSVWRPAAWPPVTPQLSLQKAQANWNQPTTTERILFFLYSMFHQQRHQGVKGRDVEGKDARTRMEVKRGTEAWKEPLLCGFLKSN